MRLTAILSRALWVLALVCWPSAAAPSWAHDGSGPLLVLAPPPASAGEAFLFAATVAIAVFGLGRRRRFALVLAAVLPFLGFEAGLHSIHHLDDPQRTAKCAVASATLHLNGTPAEAPSLAAAIERAPEPVPVAPRAAAPHRSPAPHEGRAPPLALA
jgi:hypothetical protein